MDLEKGKEFSADNACFQSESINQDKSVNQDEQVLSKRQLKLLEKRKRWLEQKPMRRAKEKEKRKLKIQKAKESGVILRPSRKMLKASKMANSTCKLKLCFDLSLSHLMTSNELSKTFKQLHRCYSINRRAPAPLQLYITGYDEKTKCAMNKMSGCFNWDVNFYEQIYCQLFNKSDIIYLTSDSPNILESFDDTKVYIIGALVDHNRLKNVCYEKAIKEGVCHARLPLDTYFKFKTRTVLTIDQVYSIILKITEGKTWISAVSDIVPKRKGIELKDHLKNDNNLLECDETLGKNLSKNDDVKEIDDRSLNDLDENDSDSKEFYKDIMSDLSTSVIVSSSETSACVDNL